MKEVVLKSFWAWYICEKCGQKHSLHFVEEDDEKWSRTSEHVCMFCGKNSFDMIRWLFAGEKIPSIEEEVEK
jgi:DNA-directed RNA polymerase subunit RPC12/RpoP